MVREEPAGGSITLGELIDEHGAALYRDFLYFYQIDLVAVVAGETRWTPRLLLSLLERFPEGSEFGAELAGGREHRDWTTQTWIMAAIANNVQVNTMISSSIPLNKRKDFHMIEGPKSRPEDSSQPTGKSGRTKKTRTRLADIMLALSPKPR